MYSDEARAEVHGVITLDDQMTRKLAGIQQSLGKLQTYGGRALSNLSKNLERLAIAGGIAGFFIVKDIVGAAAEFQDAMAAVEKTLSKPSKTPENLLKIKDGLIALSKQIPVTAVELADIAKQAGQLGIEGADDMLRFTATLAKLSKVTELDVGYAAENMGKLRTIFKMSADDLDHFGNVLIALENSAASTVQDILNVTRRFAGAGQAAGLSATQVAAFASAITSLGIMPEAAGSSLSRLFNRTSVEFANASKKAKAFAKFMGEPFKVLKAELAKNPAKFFMDFFKKINDVIKTKDPMKLLDLKKQLKDLGIVNVRDIDAVLKLGAGYAELARQMGVAEGATNELDEAAKSRFASFQNQVQLFQNKLTAVAIKLGEALMPGLLDAMNTISDWVDAHGDEIEQFAKDLSREFSNFMKNLKPETISAFVGVLRSAVGFASTLVNTFLSLPDWLKQLLIGLYVGNKLTGGVVADVIGDVMGAVIKNLGMKVIGIQAAVVQINAANVTGMGGGGIPGWNAGAGAGGGGIAGMLKSLGVITIGIVAAETARTVGSAVADWLDENGPKTPSGGNMSGDPVRLLTDVLTFNLPGLITDIGDLGGDISELIGVIGKPPPPVDLSQDTIEKMRGAIGFQPGPGGGDSGPGSQGGEEKRRGPAADKLATAQIVKAEMRNYDAIERVRSAVNTKMSTANDKATKTNANLQTMEGKMGRIAAGLQKKTPVKVQVNNKLTQHQKLSLVVDGRKIAHQDYSNNSNQSSTQYSWLGGAIGGL